ncbi:MAG: hypothetical protein JO268_03730 [Pseudonocardiales bacterium]|nr:hypothetical protein [Pseudonocardiales bacterium]
MPSIEHRALSAPAPTVPRAERLACYRFAQLFPGDTACASRMGILPLDVPGGGGR